MACCRLSNARRQSTVTLSPEKTQLRPQHTIRRTAETSGIGFFTGADVTIRFIPAPADHGIAFQRVDLTDSEPVPALIEYTVPRRRRTSIEHRGVTVEMTEHVLAALAGLQIDNCLVQLNAPEPPGCDGSSMAFVDALLEADIVDQNALRKQFVIENMVRICAEDGSSEISAKPSIHKALTIEYQLDYGASSPIPPQNFAIKITPESFVRELAFARTFVLESEVASLKKQGYGSRTTAKDLLVFGDHGIVDNQLRADDECVRHKILDCLGDLAFIGSDVCGRVSAFRSGHRLNGDLVRRLRTAYPKTFGSAHTHAA